MNRKIKTSLKSVSTSKEQKAYLLKQQHYYNTIKIYQWVIFFTFICVWEFCSRTEVINSFIFVSPSKIFDCLIEMIKNKSLFTHIGITLLEVFIGFILVIVFSLLTSILLWWNPNLSLYIVNRNRGGYSVNERP